MFRGKSNTLSAKIVNNLNEAANFAYNDIVNSSVMNGLSPNKTFV
jgi:hypothetical protein